MTAIDYREELMAIAREAVAEGPGFAQQGYVMGEAERRLRPKDRAEETRILDAWYGLFREGRLVWGSNLSNSQSPFFHIPE